MKNRFNYVTFTLMLVIPIALALIVFLAPQFNNSPSNIKIITYCITVVLGEIIVLLTSYFQSKNTDPNTNEDLQSKKNKYKVIFSIISSSIVTVSVILLASFASVTIYRVIIFLLFAISGIYFLLGEPFTSKKTFARKKQITYGLLLLSFTNFL